MEMLDWTYKRMSNFSLGLRLTDGSRGVDIIDQGQRVKVTKH